MQAGPARQETLSEQAYRQLEELIVTLRVAPGAMVTEGDLGQHLNLGRTPVREAIQRLTADGLIDIFPRKGMRIAPIDATAILQALDVRTALERLLAESAARKATQEERAAIVQHGRCMVERAEAEDLQGYMDADTDFDRVLDGAARNPYATKALQPLRAMSRRAWFYFSGAGQLEATAQRHFAMAEAILNGKPEAAAAAAEALVRDVRIGVLQSLGLTDPAGN